MSNVLQNENSFLGRFAWNKAEPRTGLLTARFASVTGFLHIVIRICKVTFGQYSVDTVFTIGKFQNRGKILVPGYFIEERTSKFVHHFDKR